MSFLAKTVFPDYNDHNNVHLYAHQCDFINWARNEVYHGRSILNGDTMGLGKTRECVFLASLTRSFRTLIVAPKSTLFQWVRECKNTYAEAEVYIASSSYAEGAFLFDNKITIGEKVSLDSLLIRERPVILISTYHAITPYPALLDREGQTAKEYELTSPLSVYIPELTPLNMFEWSMIIADEAHSLRNGVTISSERNKSRGKILKFHRMCRLRMAKNGVRVAATGTPIQNRKSDLVSIFKWMGLKLPVKMDDDWIDEMVSKHVFRRIQENLHPELQLLINFPIDEPNVENIEVVYKTPQEQEFYELVAGKISGKETNEISLLDTDYKNIQYEDLVLVRINMLRFLSASIDMFIRIHNTKNDIKYKLPTWKGSESKIEMIRDLLVRMACENTSVIVFIHFYEEADRIQASFRDYEDLFGENLGYNVFRLNGENTSLERDTILTSTKEYITNGKKCLVFANILASSEGLNLQHFNTCVFASVDWNPKIEDQAIARVHRIGQKEKVNIYKFHHKAIEGLKCQSDNIDKFMNGTKAAKIEIFDSIFMNKPNAANYAEKINMPGYNNEKGVNFIVKNPLAAEETSYDPPQFSPIRNSQQPVFKANPNAILKVKSENERIKESRAIPPPVYVPTNRTPITMTFIPDDPGAIPPPIFTPVKKPLTKEELRAERLKRFS